MNSLINDFRFITLSCFMLLGLLTQSASGNELKYVLKFNNDSNLANLYFTVLTDEEAQPSDSANLSQSAPYIESDTESDTESDEESDTETKLKACETQWYRTTEQNPFNETREFFHP